MCRDTLQDLHGELRPVIEKVRLYFVSMMSSRLVYISCETHVPKKHPLITRLSAMVMIILHILYSQQALSILAAVS